MPAPVPDEKLSELDKLTRSLKTMLGAVLAVALVVGGYLMTFIGQLEARFVTAPVFAARLELVTEGLGSLRAEVRDVKVQTNEIPKLSAKLEALQREIERVHRQ